MSAIPFEERVRRAKEKTEEANATGWEPIDLADYVNGTRKSKPPTILERSDGACLFYKGKVNGIHGESEGGKTWVCLQAAAAELLSGEHVMYLDWEDAPEGIVERLLALGVPGPVILARFHYRQPETPISDEIMADLKVEARDCSLVVVDAMTEALSTEGLKGRDENDVAEFHNRITRPLAKCGPAVVVIDHVTKDPESRQLGAIGSQHKRAGITGVSIYAECVARITRGATGRTRLYVSKDRPGHVRQEGVPHGDSTWWADFVVEALNPHQLDVHVYQPDAAAAPSKGKGKDTEADVAERIYATVPKMTVTATTNALYDRVKGNRALFGQALAMLVDGRHLVATEGKRGAMVHTMGTEPYPPSPEYPNPSDLIA